MRMAFEAKEEFDRSRNSSLSATISIDRSTFLEPTGDNAATRGIDRDFLGAIASSASDRLWQALPVTCRASVVR
jgi:hypothetical protein